MSGREWTVVVRGDWYLPHFVNMLKEYRGNAEQRSCATDVIAQIEAQMVPVDGDLSSRTTRPLVVIDPEDREQVARLAEVVMQTPNASGWTDRMQAALREFANPTLPKPEEPTGLGAVVVDADGQRWVRFNAMDDDVWVGDYSNRPYADITAVRVLSEGVTA